MKELVLALGAGIATVASPCILPMLPIVIGASAGQADRRRPLFVVGGFVACFVGAVLLFGASTDALGLDANTLRQLAAVGLLMAGVLMAWPVLADRVMTPLGALAGPAQRLAQRAGTGPLGGLLLGATLGLLWAPCAGPVLAAILALVAGAQTGEAAPRLAAFALGAGLPMLAIAYGGQATTTRVRALARHAGRIRRGFGALVMVTAVAMLTHWDVRLTAALTSAWPAAEAHAADAPVAAGDLAPEFSGIDAWLNSPPLTVQGLRGQVVLVDFWTYGCINCVRTLPALKRWHERYASQGLVIVGVHTPEFAFERPLANLRDAVARHHIAYPVAQDNRYATWTAFRNRYWPALYLIDREGRIVYRHFGEGDEAAVQARIEAELARPLPAGR
ncbi:MAG TPA: cytochrome c biogenesis protein DipZ [Ideonella sp.]|uniref:cytochrome c biogenesis protein DipZ n=1 Tax=Ideonella sp. TaxID=1929293 RepID=UPI002E2F9A5B|nr:cytochrome c biogenesis protein DipZ [Ideonella sp.]HEX5688132.1 cytochrome c biogenesis protein DipZ [Ideonella sp.]